MLRGSAVTEQKTPNIFSYTDYRIFMKDFFAFMKSTKPFFSYQYFAQKAGFKAKSFVYKVIKGERALSQNSVFSIARALNLKGKEIAFFEALVHFNESTTTQEREYYFTRMQQVEPKSSGVRLQTNQFNYFAKWYHVVVRELVTIVPFGDDYKMLAAAVQPAITPKQAKESVQLLLKLGMIRKSDNSKLYKQTDAYITTRDAIVTLAINKFQRDTMELALKSHEDDDRQNQDFSTLTVGVSARGYEKIRSELKDFRSYISRIVEEDNPVDRIYQFNFQLFPVTSIRNPLKKGRAL
jgi:uncharacterized protein (TIGR02147 family)